VQYVIGHPLVARTKFTICTYLEYFLALNNTNQIMMRMSDDATVASSLERQGRTDRYTDQSLDDDSAMLDARFPIK
jgi:CO dehydrogenase/acetyl-CoA synthase beta subunit